MPDRADRIHNLVQRAGVSYLASLALSVTIMAVLLVSQERVRVERAEISEAGSQIAALKPLAAELFYARDLLAEHLIARYGAFDSTEKILRRLAFDLRAARLSWQAVGRKNREGVLGPDPARSRILGRGTALLSFNTNEPPNEEAPALQLADLSHGSFRQPSTLEELKLNDLARYLYAVSLDPSRIAVTSMESIEELGKFWDTGPSDVARLKSATVWEIMIKFREEPELYGLTTDAMGQVTLAEILTNFEWLRKKARVQDNLVQIKEAVVQPLGLGVPMTLAGTVSLAPWVLAGLMFVAGLLFLRAARLAAAINGMIEVTPSLPVLAEATPQGGFGWFALFAETVLCFLPFLLLAWVSIAIKATLWPVVVTLIASVFLFKATVGIRKALP